MTDTTIARLNGLLLAAASIIGESPFTYTFRVNLFEATAPHPLESYKQYIFNPEYFYDENNKDDYSFSQPTVISNALIWLEDRFEKALLGKFPNSAYIIWKAVDEICMLNDWKRFKDSYLLQMSDGRYEGDLILIPIENNVLSLFFGCLTEEERKNNN